MYRTLKHCSLQCAKIKEPHDGAVTQAEMLLIPSQGPFDSYPPLSVKTVSEKGRVS